MKEKLKALQGFLIGIIFIIPLVLLIITFISGIDWLWNSIVNPILPTAFWWAFRIFIFSLLLAFIKPTRFVGTVGLYISSYIFGAITWIFSLAIVWFHWGLIAVIIGLFIAGVGVLPIAILATMFTGNWSLLLIFLLLIVSFIIPRILAYYFTNKLNHDNL